MFVVKNIKTGAKPVRELKKAITAKVGPLYKNALEKVKQQWDKYEADLEIEARRSNTGTGHEIAENIAKGQKGPRDALTQNKDEKKLKKWWTIERNVGVTELGVGKSVQLAAEGYWSVLNGANCNYAIKHGEEYSYSITKCKITNNQAKSLSNKIN